MGTVVFRNSVKAWSFKIHIEALCGINSSLLNVHLYMGTIYTLLVDKQGFTLVYETYIISLMYNELERSTFSFTSLKKDVNPSYKSLMG